jgi:hypothetical protein
LRRLQTLLARGLTATAPLWPELRIAYGWVHQAAHLLANAAGQDVFTLRRAYRRLLVDMHQERATVGALAPAITHFRTVTKSYWPGLFQCYQVADLPRTNNELEHFFGCVRHHERRVSGRKAAPPTLVIRGAVRLVAAVATRLKPPTPTQLRPIDLIAWQTLRADLEYRHEARRAQGRFRRNPSAYLAQVEATLLQASLPP